MLVFLYVATKPSLLEMILIFLHVWGKVLPLVALVQIKYFTWMNVSLPYSDYHTAQLAISVNCDTISWPTERLSLVLSSCLLSIIFISGTAWSGNWRLWEQHRRSSNTSEMVTKKVWRTAGATTRGREGSKNMEGKRALRNRIPKIQELWKEKGQKLEAWFDWKLPDLNQISLHRCL